MEERTCWDACKIPPTSVPSVGVDDVHVGGRDTRLPLCRQSNLQTRGKYIDV